jgi:histidyl-tRNA synthetase
VALRRLGLAVERDASGSAFGKQFKRAERSGAAWVAVIGEEEVAKGQLRLKRLGAAGDATAAVPDAESTVPLGDAGAVLTSLRLLNQD